jgi:nucleotide-binding universal stress UspA family protein
MLKRILVELQGSLAIGAQAAYAIDLSLRRRAAITGLAAIDFEAAQAVGPVPLGAGESAHELREHRVRASLEARAAAVAALRSATEAVGAPCQIQEVEGCPQTALIEQSRYHDLTVVALPAASPGAVMQLISRGVRPILAVPSTARPVQRVLIAYGGSHEAATALRQFMQLRPWPDALVRVATFAGDEDQARSLLDDAAAYCAAHDCAVETDWIAGDPRLELLAYARGWSADLIVAGNSSRTVILQKILGDTAFELLRQADCPLFLAQ